MVKVDMPATDLEDCSSRISSHREESAKEAKRLSHWLKRKVGLEQPFLIFGAVCGSELPFKSMPT